MRPRRDFNLIVAAGAVRWHEALATPVASVPGGYLGAPLTRLLPLRVAHRFAVALTASVTPWFFWRLLAGA